MNTEDLYKYNILGQEITEGISLITAVKNRQETLREAIPTWIAQKEIDEIVILDWASDESLIPLVNEFQDGRIILAVVEDQPKWILSYAYNLAARLASKNKLLKIDADVKVNPGFFSRHKLEEGIFYTGNWEIARNDNERHLNGSVFCFRDDFFKVNGYNEYIQSYGWDDSDLYNRMKEAGLVRKNIDLDYLHHIEHVKRTSFQNKTDFIRSIDDMERSLLNILINYHLCTSHVTWSVKNKLLEFAVEPSEENIYFLKQSSPSENTVSAEVMQDCEVKAIKQRLGHLDEKLVPEIENKLTRDELNEFYNLVFSKKNSAPDLHLYSLIKKMNIAPGAELQSLQTRLDEKDAALKSIQNQLKNLYASWSWRISHFICSGIGWILNLFKRKK